MHRCLLCSSLLFLLLSTDHRAASAREDGLTIAVSGGKVFSSEYLTAFTRKCLVNYEYPTQKDEMRERILHECQRSLRNDLASYGYMQAEIEAEASTVGDDGRTDISLRVEEGIRYLLGEVRMDGMVVLTPEFARTLLAVKSGEPVDGKALGKWLYENLKREYGKLGYIQYSPEITPEFIAPEKEGRDGIVHVNVEIDEGKQFTLRRIEFSGNQKTEDDTVRQMLFIKEGEVFNQESYEQTIARLNESGWFDEVTEKNVNMKAGEDGVIDLRITVREK